MDLEIPDQRLIWDPKHIRTIAYEICDNRLRDIPNDSAVEFAKILPSGSTILEVGSGTSGRDARYWASLGHTTYCLEISPIAVERTAQVAQEQGVADRVHPITYDVKDSLPSNIHEISFNGFYARSSLQLSDEQLDRFTKNLNKQLVDGSIIMIEGKTPDDSKLRRSIRLDGDLTIDPEEKGHVRRVWTEESMKNWCLKSGWECLETSRYRSKKDVNSTPSNFIRLIAKKKVG